MNKIAAALVALQSLSGCGFGLFKAKAPRSNASSSVQEESPGSQPNTVAPSAGPSAAQSHIQTLVLNFVQSAFSGERAFQGFKNGVSLLDPQTLLLWSKGAKLVSTKDPLKTEQANFGNLPRPVCNNASLKESVAWVEDQGFWCLGADGSLKRARFNATNSEFVQSEASIAKFLKSGSAPTILAARPETLLLNLGSELLLVSQAEDPKQYSTERLVLPEKLQANLTGAGFSAAPARHIWVHNAQKLFFRDLADASQQAWLEHNLVLKVGEVTMGSEAEVSFLVKSWQKPELSLTAVLWHEGHYFVSEGSVTSVSQPGNGSGPGTTFKDEDPYWESKGRSLIQSNCTGCHQHSFGQNPPDLELVIGAKEEILRRTGLEPSSADVMPPYGRARVPAAQLKEFRDWLDRQD